jgi:hypothetical protein
MGKCDGLGNTVLANDDVGGHVVRHLASDPAGPLCQRTMLGFPRTATV